MSFGLDIAIVQHFDGEVMPGARQIMRLIPLGTGDEQRLITNWESVIPGSPSRPTLSLGDQEAMALHVALAAQFQGVDDQRMLRQDYEAERSRVDRLVEVISGIAGKVGG